MTKNCAIIVAAGKGTRMGSKLSKQFISIKDKPILYYTLKVFDECKSIDSIILILAKEEIDYCKKEILCKYSFNKPIKIIEGGIERQYSVQNGLKEVKDCEIVLIHDGARPFVDAKTIEKGIEYARLYGACACGVRPKDTVKVRDENGFSSDTPDRNTLFLVQTPQCFRYELILECHNKVNEEKISVTDDTMVLERYGHKVFLYEGDYKNIKITTPEDLLVAERLLEVEFLNATN